MNPVNWKVRQALFFCFRCTLTLENIFFGLFIFILIFILSYLVFICKIVLIFVIVLIHEKAVIFTLVLILLQENNTGSKSQTRRRQKILKLVGDLLDRSLAR